LLCDSNGHPLHVHITAGQTHESQALETLLEGVEVVGDEAGMLHPVRLAGDKGFRADWIDEYLLGLGIVPVIPSKVNEHREARPVMFDEEAYVGRNIIERLIGWLKESRRILTRFEKTAKNYLGMLKVAFIHRYLRLLCP
jgi:transposase